jgi:acid stress-induced BolA-like protein IbaG/YrbA
MQNLCFGTECTVLGYRSCVASILLHWTQMMFGSVSEYFNNLRQVKRCKTCVWGLNALFRGTEVVKHPFYSIGPKLMFGSVSDHFTNLWQVTRCKTSARALMHYFRVPKSWNISIGPKVMFGSVSENFNNLRQVKRCKTCVSGLNALFWGTEVV